MLLIPDSLLRSSVIIAAVIAFLWAARGYPKWRKRRLTAQPTTGPNSDQTPVAKGMTSDLSSHLNIKSIPVLPLALVYIIIRAAWDLFCLSVNYFLLGCERLARHLDLALFHFLTVRLPVLVGEVERWWIETGYQKFKSGWRWFTASFLPATVKAIDTLAWRLSNFWTAFRQCILITRATLQALSAKTRAYAVYIFHAVEAPVVWTAWRMYRLAVLLSDGVVRISKAVWRDIYAVAKFGAKILQAFWDAIGFPISVFIVNKIETVYRVTSRVASTIGRVVFTYALRPAYSVIHPVVILICDKAVAFWLSAAVQTALRRRRKMAISTFSMFARDTGHFIQSCLFFMEWSVVQVIIPLYKTVRIQLLPWLSNIYITVRTSAWRMVEPLMTILSPLISPVMRGLAQLYDVLLHQIVRLYTAMTDALIWLINRIRFQHHFYRLCQALYAQCVTAASVVYNQCAAAYAEFSAFFWKHAPAISQLFASISEQVVALSAKAWEEAQIIGGQISSTISVEAEAVAQSLERVLGNWINAQTDEGGEAISEPKLKSQ
ncbi:hypothetical protein INT43_007052 [Umbelopsis isabellina]|uniref:Uncharacterized protein n=1 Tax=Mortierella isabellina TaxID=91625 RepID=A0A8H7PY95_MORIS|nr:hypothetical protein INT43_007052 [Umbelopsis isabellina]